MHTERLEIQQDDYEVILPFGSQKNSLPALSNSVTKKAFQTVTRYGNILPYKHITFRIKQIQYISREAVSSVAQVVLVLTAT